MTDLLGVAGYRPVAARTGHNYQRKNMSNYNPVSRHGINGISTLTRSELQRKYR